MPTIIFYEYRPDLGKSFTLCLFSVLKGGVWFYIRIRTHLICERPCETHTIIAIEDRAFENI